MSSGSSIGFLGLVLAVVLVTGTAAAQSSVTATIGIGGNLFGIAIPSGPTNKDQCKNGGWATCTNPSFKSQGDCIKYVN